MFAQRRRATRPACDVRISKKNPSVYITFEREGKIASARTGEIQETVWLRLRNNTRWPIILDMNGVPSKDYGDAFLFYDVLSRGKVLAEGRCHVCSFNHVSPGRSLVFTVPREDLAEGFSIRVSFNYGWEDESIFFTREGVQHSVSFYSSNITKSGR
jgi:hypothetical protein